MKLTAEVNVFPGHYHSANLQYVDIERMPSLEEDYEIVSKSNERLLTDVYLFST